MRLLIVTQEIDAADSNLGFFVRWIEKLVEHAGVVVIANETNADTVSVLSASISAHSLGKESDASRLSRLIRYQRLLIQNLSRVDGVFFHMCPEYVIGAHFLPWWFGVRTALWYVCKAVSWRLRLAALLVNRIFTASRESCRLSSKKVEVVGHGIDTDLFSGERKSAFAPCLITAGRISPVKDLHTLILGFLQVRNKFPNAAFSIIGNPITDADRAYQEALAREFNGAVQFNGGVPYSFMPSRYAEATIFVHASRTGSMDKAVLEALASGLPVITSSEAFSEGMGIVRFKKGNPSDLATQIEVAYGKGGLGYNEVGREWVKQHHDLDRLIRKILLMFQD